MSQQTMEFTNAYASYRARLFFAVCGVGLVILVSFSIFNYISGNVPATCINAAMVLIGAGAIFALIESRKIL